MRPIIPSEIESRSLQFPPFQRGKSVEPEYTLSPEQSFLLTLDQAGITSPIQEFSLGAELHTANENVFWILKGQVRLLCTPPSHNRPLTVCVMEPGGSVGAEVWLGVNLLPYQAIAASNVRLICLSAQQVQQLVEHFPDWRTRLIHQVEECDRLIFLRHCVALEGGDRTPPWLRSLQPLALQWQQVRVAAGDVLATATPPQAGRFWLRQGVVTVVGDGIHTPVAQNNGHPKAPRQSPPTLGSSWGYPDPIPNCWQAQTDLLLYQLTPDQWENWNFLRGATNATTVEAAEAVSTGTDSSPPPPTAMAPASTPVSTREPRSPLTAEFPKPVQRQLLDLLEHYPWVEQQSSSDCGAACLSMAARYWGKNVPVYVLRERANVGRSGASLKSLAKAAESIGFHARPVRASLSRLAHQEGPWVAHWEGSHYVVVYRVSEHYVLIADPAEGRKKLSRQTFQSHWTGYALLLDPTQQLQATEVKQSSLGRYLGALIPYRRVILQIVVVSLLIQLFALITPLFTQIILDRVVTERSQSTLNVFALGLVMFSVWRSCLDAVRQYLLSYFSNRLDLTLLSGFIRYALALPLHFFEARRVGDLLTRVQENEKIHQFFIGQMVLSWLEFLTGFVYLGLMLYYNWQLTLLVLLMIPPIVGVTLGATPFLRRISRQIFNATAEQNSSLVEMISGIATVKSAAAEQDLRWRWEDRLTTEANVLFRGQKLGIGLEWTSGIVNALGSAALLWYGATLVIAGQLTVGQLVAFNIMLDAVISPVVSLSGLWDEMQEVLISVERLNDVFEAQPEETQQATLVLPTLRGEVTFENITFRYGEDEERNTLQNISLTAHPGETIAIVGRSGSGKTTLVKLIQGLYVPNSGRISVDGHDLRHISLYSLRSQIGIVPQECFLFSGTILENITLFRSEYSLEQVIEVAKLAEAHGFIQALPLGYSTVVGERGSMLSGGQRQRIAIARALLGNPRILILDEATSSLDTESERRFQRNLMQISRDRTTFIIAHRLSTVRHANRILVLDRGILVEQGTHEELLQERGLYAHLAHQQLDL